MADAGTVKSYMAALDSGTRRVFNQVFEYILKDIRFGRGDVNEPAQNLGGGFFQGTTPGVANTEFSIVHTFGRIPYLLIPILPLDQVNGKIVRLTLARAADSRRVYLKSPDTSAVFTVYLEG